MNTKHGLLAVATATALLLTAGCSGSAINDEQQPAGAELPIGMVVSRTGVYKTVGDDMVAGFQLYLDQHDGTLGGRKIKLVIEDEQDGGAPAFQSPGGAIA